MTNSRSVLKNIKVSISLVTIGVDDVRRSVDFYTSFGWEMSPDSDPAMCTFINTPSTILGIVGYDFLARDALLEPIHPRPKYQGFTLAVNGASPEEVDEIYANALRNGGTAHQQPKWKDWGGYDGYSGYFLDPDGYPWEVAHAPFLKLTPDGRLIPKSRHS